MERGEQTLGKRGTEAGGVGTGVLALAGSRRDASQLEKGAVNWEDSAGTTPSLCPSAASSHGGTDPRRQRPFGKAGPHGRPPQSVLTGRCLHSPEVRAGRRPAQLPVGLPQGGWGGPRFPSGAGKPVGSILGRGGGCPGAGRSLILFCQLEPWVLLLQSCLSPKLLLWLLLFHPAQLTKGGGNPPVDPGPRASSMWLRASQPGRVCVDGGGGGGRGALGPCGALRTCSQ